ncbi:MAG: nuclear transport factor 2 family protein [Betaproteobacteria bacterium]|nr:nuclear transport factor 2 family protein [Betaproteobacteria bacterium]
MRHFTTPLFFCVLQMISGLAYAAACEPVTEAQVQAAEDARYAAQITLDYSALENLLADDLMYIHSSAVVNNKQSYMASMRDGSVRYLAMKRSDVQVRTFGCVAVMTGVGQFDVQLKDKLLNVELRFHSLWINREGRLQFVSWQSTRLPQK